MRPLRICKDGLKLMLDRSQARQYSSSLPNARLNVQTDYATTSLLHHTSKACLSSPALPESARNSTTRRMNMYQAINDALNTALTRDESVIVFGEDVAFGGVFRCTMDLAINHGSQRVFNTPLTEQGIAGFAIGAAAAGLKPVAEIQFADYVYPAFDQLVNEAAKFRYREGPDGFDLSGMVVRMPCGGVGHGALYHSQSPESLFTHIPGLRVVMPRSPMQAKGLLLAAISARDPVVFMEPKVLYRAAVEQVPVDSFEIPLSKAEVLKPGSDLTVISYGTPLYNCQSAIEHAEQDFSVSIELVDLRTVYPWDQETVLESVRRTGRAIVVHESMVNAGIGAEVAAVIQEGAFLKLECPVQRIAAWSTHNALSFERFMLPDTARIYDAIKTSINY